VRSGNHFAAFSREFGHIGATSQLAFPQSVRTRAALDVPEFVWETPFVKIFVWLLHLLQSPPFAAADEAALTRRVRWRKWIQLRSRSAPMMNKP
jgi:hypothetical protein